MSNESRDSIASYLSRVMNADGAPLPKNRVKVQIAGEEFTIVAAEPEEYIRRVASLVDAKITAILDSSRCRYRRAEHGLRLVFRPSTAVRAHSRINGSMDAIASI